MYFWQSKVGIILRITFREFNGNKFKYRLPTLEI